MERATNAGGRQIHHTGGFSEEIFVLFVVAERLQLGPLHSTKSDLELPEIIMEINGLRRFSSR
jgi:hypothetical protein